MKKFIERGSELRKRAEQLIEQRGNDDAKFSLSEVKFLPPIAQPAKIICVGLKLYRSLQRKLGSSRRLHQSFFPKYANAIVGHNDVIEIPINSKEVDFEAQHLRLSIGKKAKNVSEEEANDYVFGYTIMNDISARDLQFQDGQWSRGKTAEHLRHRPVVVTDDEVGDPHRAGDFP